MGEGLESSTVAIDSSNRGFQLLKKAGWTEGTGLGAFHQGRLEPVQAHVKINKRGVGAEITKKRVAKLSVESTSKTQNDNGGPQSKKKAKTLSKRQRKLKEEEERAKEQEFVRAFYREFWPDNV